MIKVNLGERLEIADAQGAWKDLADAFNNLLESVSQSNSRIPGINEEPITR